MSCNMKLTLYCVQFLTSLRQNNAIPVTWFFHSNTRLKSSILISYSFVCYNCETLLGIGLLFHILYSHFVHLDTWFHTWDFWVNRQNFIELYDAISFLDIFFCKVTLYWDSHAVGAALLFCLFTYQNLKKKKKHCLFFFTNVLYYFRFVWVMWINWKDYSIP